MSNILEFNQVSFAYSGSNALLEKMTFSVKTGEFLAVVGQNGSGKSTLFKLILGLNQPMEGLINVLGTSPQRARQHIGYVPQFATFPKDFPITVEQAVLMGRLSATPVFGYYRKKDRTIARDILVRMGLLTLRDRPIHYLSGGQLQKVLIARALVSQPKLLLLDEPTASIDPHAEENLFDFLKELNRSMTILFISHDIGFISHYVKRVICVNRHVWCHNTSKVTPEVIQQIYGENIRVIEHHQQNQRAE